MENFILNLLSKHCEGMTLNEIEQQIPITNFSFLEAIQILIVENRIKSYWEKNKRVYKSILIK